MKNKLDSEELLHEFSMNPNEFVKQGLGYELLQKYFSGFSIETLRPFLSSDKPVVRKEAIAILSELGMQGCSLIDDAIHLVHDTDVAVQYDALETVFLCSANENTKEFTHIIHAMQAGDFVIRILAMRLVSNASKSQLHAAKVSYDGANIDLHQRGISLLLNLTERDQGTILELINGDHQVSRKYGVIAAKMLRIGYPKLIESALSSSDGDVRMFAQNSVEHSTD